MKKDIIVLTGTSGVGKTLAGDILMRQLQNNNIPHDEITHSTGEYIVDVVKKDDKQGGNHHFHPWNKAIFDGHNHKNNEPILPFTTFDDILNDEAYKQFFASLTCLPYTQKLFLADWTAGVNINTVEPFNQVDRSYKKMKSKLENGVWENGWLKRVLAVLHIQADYLIRKKFNDKKKEIMDKTTWKLSKISFNYYGKDDFSKIEPYLKKHSITIYTLNNDGTAAYARDICKVSKDINPQLHI